MARRRGWVNWARWHWTGLFDFVQLQAPYVYEADRLVDDGLARYREMKKGYNYPLLSLDLIRKPAELPPP